MKDSAVAVQDSSPPAQPPAGQAAKTAGSQANAKIVTAANENEHEPIFIEIISAAPVFRIMHTNIHKLNKKTAAKMPGHKAKPSGLATQASMH
jgi:hypothetical protein